MIEKYGILATINFIEQIKMTGWRGNTLSFWNFMIYCSPFSEIANDALRSTDWSNRTLQCHHLTYNSHRLTILVIDAVQALRAQRVGSQEL